MRGLGSTALFATYASSMHLQVRQCPYSSVRILGEHQKRKGIQTPARMQTQLEILAGDVEADNLSRLYNTVCGNSTTSEIGMDSFSTKAWSVSRPKY